MIYMDQPIESKMQDCLKRTEFSKQLAKAILSYTKKDNFAISLCGKWGSGKTSILNMVIEEIKDIAKDKSETEKPIIVKFNPWNYSDSSQLISQFFLEIQQELKIHDNGKNMKEVGNALQRYSSVWEYTKYIPKVGKYFKLLNGAFKGVGEHLAEKANERNSLAEQRKKVIEALGGLKRKIIIIIDDIDRLNNEQICLIFQLVNSVAGFPNMIYLLSFDRNVVARALQKEQNCNGEEYLEKIIQVPFEVPEANHSLICDIFSNRYCNILFNETRMETNFERNYWESILDKCISPFLNSIRDVNRIINTFEFKYNLMRNEINPIDLIALTTLQVCAPTIHEWIYNNSYLLMGSTENCGDATGKEVQEEQEHYLKICENVYRENASLMMNVLQTLFPCFSFKTGRYIYEKETEHELRRKNKVASKDRFERYFNLSLEDIKITQNQVENTIYIYSEEELRKYFDVLIESNALLDYLNELLAFAPEIPETRRKFFVLELIKLQAKNEALNVQTNSFTISVYKCAECIDEILKHGKKEDNVDILMALIESADFNTLPSISKLMETLSFCYGRHGYKKTNSGGIVEEAELEKIEPMFLEKMKMIGENRCIFDYEDIGPIYRLWNNLDKMSWNKYVKTMLLHPVNVPKYLSMCASVWSDGRTRGWDFSEKTFAEYIGANEAYEKILSIKNTKDFSLLEHCFKEVAVAYYIWYCQSEKDRHNITKELVNAIIPQWEENAYVSES